MTATYQYIGEDMPINKQDLIEINMNFEKRN